MIKLMEVPPVCSTSAAPMGVPLILHKPLASSSADWGRRDLSLDRAVRCFLCVFVFISLTFPPALLSHFNLYIMMIYTSLNKNVSSLKKKKKKKLCIKC